MTNAKKEINVACNYLLRLIKAHVQLSNEQIQLFKRVFHETLSKRFVDHWFPANPHRGSAYRCLQTKHWRDPVFRTIAERSRLPLHRYLPAVFTLWIDPGEVAVCFGDEGTWCPLYEYDLLDEDVHQEYSDGEETVSSLSSDDDVSSLTDNVKTLSVNESPSKHVSTESNDSRSSSPFSQLMFNGHPTGSISHDWQDQKWSLWPSSLTQSDALFLYNREEHL